MGEKIPTIKPNNLDDLKITKEEAQEVDAQFRKIAEEKGDSIEKIGKGLDKYDDEDLDILDEEREREV